MGSRFKLIVASIHRVYGIIVQAVPDLRITIVPVFRTSVLQKMTRFHSHSLPHPSWVGGGTSPNDCRRHHQGTFHALLHNRARCSGFAWRRTSVYCFLRSLCRERQCKLTLHCVDFRIDSTLAFNLIVTAISTHRNTYIAFPTG